jgi:hypothetical protein
MKLKTHHTTIPATPGWYRCSPIFKGSEVVDIYRTPVIAWIVSVDESCGILESFNARAVIADDMVFANDPEYLQRPNGSYVEPEHDSNMTREDLMDRMQQRLGSREGEKNS